MEDAPEKAEASVPKMGELTGDSGGGGVGILPVVLVVLLAIAAYFFMQE